MSYELRDGVLLETYGEDGDVEKPLGPVDEAVSDALDVLRAAWWDVTDEFYKHVDDGSTRHYVVAVSPERVVDHG